VTALRGIPALALLLALLGLSACGGSQAPPPPRTEAPPPPPESRTLAHTVQEGETLERIADLYYGDPGRAADIAASNGIDDPSRLAAGSVLQLGFAEAEYQRARERAAALEPYNQGVSALARGNLDEAERQFRLALRVDPGLPDARYNLALVLLKRGQAEAAEELLRRLRSERPGDADFGFALGNALFAQTRYLEAATVFDQVLAVHPENRRAAFGHARALQEAGAHQEARAAWRRYLELDTESSWAAEARRHLAELDGG